jgi:N5-(cytidine 5'-diphosphoramidyl)-L-glutamine hydrolase
MKKIAITQRIISNKTYFEQREALDIRWSILFKELNYLPIILPIGIDFKEYFHNNNIEGIMLTGGNDLNSLNINDLSRLRDIYELNLISYGIENEIPIFGVCRGMQIVAKYFESTFKKVKDHVAVNHKLIVSKNSKYRENLLELDNVNSYHNYAIDKVGKNLIVSAFSDDKSIEAIEHTKSKIFGQMWHSERQQPFKKEELRLIKTFFNND